MKNLYCSILSSGLVGAKRNDPFGYRISIFMVASMLGMFNLGLIDRIFTYSGIWQGWNFVQVDTFKNIGIIHGCLDLNLNYGLLPLLLDYFLIYYDDHYKKLMKNYPQKDGKLFIYYGIISMLLMLLTVIIGRWLFVHGMAHPYVKMEPWITIG